MSNSDMQALRERVLDKAREDLGITTWPQILARADQYFDYITRPAKPCAEPYGRPAPPLPPIPIDVRNVRLAPDPAAWRS